ncbi:OadG family protein [Campylobacter sp. RM9344]|uniref:Probable oxaloacetate decarboxylase gamma chain n=1 Tax=Campylobacter californiensis TaxID=1032243 RepID=A0AAW3ZU80_9BACT|nr:MULTISPECIES: OadG family transporter subunit [unclassified Campylobacter]MBE2984694.1 OadG family protein [Campylobacter sp. RM6883]MBE2986457.1 OadG family protein [Campylobacter sp. RM12919]MBE2987828.1 OadG family protein [Campylobacter sp. RM12920]MBE2994610.1 OadG family protein [Campylobacter sp. RM6913]MBE3029136.1 OadG family protein [Campylobacter sp. RM9344]
MQVNLVAEGFRFMILGMSSVFLFLMLMVLVLKIQAKIFERFASMPDVLPPPSKPNQTSINNNELVAVIGAAINQYKKNTRR